MLAEKIGMSQGTFNNKIRNDVYKFTAEEESKINEVLKIMAKEISELFYKTSFQYKIEVSEDLKKALQSKPKQQIKDFTNGEPNKVITVSETIGVYAQKVYPDGRKEVEFMPKNIIDGMLKAIWKQEMKEKGYTIIN